MQKKEHPDASLQEVDGVMESAWSCFSIFRKLPGKDRGMFLRSIATHLTTRKDNLVLIADSETSLGPERLHAELKRAISELELFADLAESEKWKEHKKEESKPDRQPIPKPGMLKSNVPLGPVVVIGACNFPFAISVVGTDTASALAVGCPVIVKAHPDHARTCQSLAVLVEHALEETRMPPNAFQLVHGSDHSVTRALVDHRRTACAAFTGSFQGGKALHNLASQRKIPIPFHAEMGSLNPVIILPHALKHSGIELARGYIAAVNLFAGQMCTKPGMLIVMEGEGVNQFRDEIKTAVNDIEPSNMLNRTVFENFQSCNRTLESTYSLIASNRSDSQEDTNQAPCQVFETKGNNFLNERKLHAEVFGPSSILVRCKDEDELLAVTSAMEGSLTGTIHALPGDRELAQKMIPVMESLVGRILWGGFPPGVIPSIATHHGGPWPAATDSRHTSIGLFAYRRFVRPVCRQGLPS